MPERSRVTLATPHPRRLGDRAVAAMRLRNLSPRTQEAYIGWMRRYYEFHGRRDPASLAEDHVTAFLNALVTRDNVAACTQNQALSAIAFLYKQVLGRELPWLGNLVRAKGPDRLPVVLTRAEIRSVLAHLHGVARLRVFRGKLLDRFDQTLKTRTPALGASLGGQLLRQAAAREWVVYSKAPMAGPEQVLRYLGRYTHRIAIGNERLVALQDGKVTFRYRDRRRGSVRRLMTLEANQFIHRFFLHVLPRGFVRVRHYGFQANGQRRQLIARARQLLDDPAPPVPQPIRESWPDLFRRLTGRDPLRCPSCIGGVLRIVSAWTAPALRPRGP